MSSFSSLQIVKAVTKLCDDFYQAEFISNRLAVVCIFKYISAYLTINQSKYTMVLVLLSTDCRLPERSLLLFWWHHFKAWRIQSRFPTVILYPSTEFVTHMFVTLPSYITSVLYKILSKSTSITNYKLHF